MSAPGVWPGLDQAAGEQALRHEGSGLEALKVSSGTWSPAVPCTRGRRKLLSLESSPSPPTPGTMLARGGWGQGAHCMGGQSSQKGRAGTGVVAFSPCLKPQEGCPSSPPHPPTPAPPFGSRMLGVSGLQMLRGLTWANGQ